MFSVSEAEAATVRAAFEQDSELSASIDLRRLFPGIIDGAKTGQLARLIAGWRRVPVSRPTREHHRRNTPR